jgi:hypothetical protein
VPGRVQSCGRRTLRRMQLSCATPVWCWASRLRHPVVIALSGSCRHFNCFTGSRGKSIRISRPSRMVAQETRLLPVAVGDGRFMFSASSEFLGTGAHKAQPRDGASLVHRAGYTFTTIEPVVAGGSRRHSCVVQRPATMDAAGNAGVRAKATSADPLSKRFLERLLWAGLTWV